MTIVYGSKQVAFTSRDVAENEEMVPGKIYEAEYEISGIRTIVPGWEDDAINQIQRNIESTGCEVLYIAIDAQRRNYVHVQWKYPVSENAQAALVWIVPIAYAVAAIVITVCAIWLVLTLTGSVKEIGTLMTDNPQISLAIYGVIGIAGIAALIYLVREFRSDDDEHDHSHEG